jgi:hypothetical protein
MPVACGVAWGEEWEPGRRGKEEACVGGGLERSRLWEDRGRADASGK